MIINSPVRTHGGKSRIKNWLFKNFPPTNSYSKFVDLFGGGGSITLNIPQPSYEQIYNDLDPKLYYLMFNLKHNLDEFQKIVSLIECTEQTFLKWKEIYDTDSYDPSIIGNNWSIEKSVAVYVTKKMSRGGMGKDFSESSRLRGKREEHVNCWENGKLELKRISQRLKTIHLHCIPAQNLFSILNCDKDTFVYADPPYVKSTRSAKEVYDFELSDKDHAELAELFNKSTAKIAISGYESKLYAELYPESKWRIVKKEVANNAGQNKVKQKRIECLWLNY